MEPITKEIITSGREIAFSRIFNVTPEVMFEVWTNPEHIAYWWGPSGFTNTILDMDVRPGGVWRYIMHGPDGTDYPNLITYKEVDKPNRLVYLHGDDQDPSMFEVTVTFEDLGEKTRLSMTSLFRSEKELREVVEKHGAIEGLKQNMDRLENWLSNL